MTGTSALRKSVATGSVLVAVSTAFGAGILVAEARHDRPRYQLSATGRDGGLSCDRLLDWYVHHGLDRVTAWGWDGPAYRVLAGSAAEPQARQDSVAPAPTSSLDTQTGSSTGTNVQEANVDEPDVAKVQGDLLVHLGNGALLTDALSGPAPQRLGAAPLGRIGDPRLLLSGDRAVVIGGEVEDPAAAAPWVSPSARTRVLTYDLSDPSNPTLVASRLYDGALVTARQVTSTIRLVLDVGLPTLDFETPSSSTSQRAALSHNRQLVRASSIEDWLPRATSFDDGRTESTPLVDCADVAVPETFTGLGTLTLVGFDPASPDDADVSAVATGSDTAYM